MRKTYNRAGWIYACFFAILIVLQLVAGMVFKAMGISTENFRYLSITINCIAMYGVGFWVCFALFKKLPKGGGIEQEKWGIGKLALCFVVCVSAMYIGNIAGNVLMVVTGILTGKGTPTNQLADAVMESSVWGNLIPMVLLAPVVEEWLFRKLLLDRIAKFGQFAAVMLSAFLFALAHGNFYQFFYAFGLGVIFAYVYLKTGKLRYSITFHMMINFMGSVLAPGLVKMQMANLGEDFVRQMIVTALLVMYSLTLIVCTVAGIVLFFCNLKKIYFLPAEEPVARWDSLRAVVTSPGIWVYVLICAGMFVQSMMV